MNKVAIPATETLARQSRAANASRVYMDAPNQELIKARWEVQPGQIKEWQMQRYTMMLHRVFLLVALACPDRSLELLFYLDRCRLIPPQRMCRSLSRVMLYCQPWQVVGPCRRSSRHEKYQNQLQRRANYCKSIHSQASDVMESNSIRHENSKYLFNGY